MARLVRVLAAAAVFVGAALVCAAIPGDSGQDLQALHRSQYEMDRPKTVLELQPFRTETRVLLERAEGGQGAATLTNLNPNVSAWFLLNLEWPGEPAAQRSYHLQNAVAGAELSLLQGDARALRIAGWPDGAICTLWGGEADGPLDRAVASRLTFAPLCDGRLYLRNVVSGHRSMLERATDFLRDHVWKGDEIVSFVKREAYRDAFVRPETLQAGHCAAAAGAEIPAAAQVGRASSDGCLRGDALALDVVNADADFAPGQWYPVRDLPGVFASIIAPADIAPELLVPRTSALNSLDLVESQALVFLAAFDLTQFSLHFSIGTEHPRVDWSPRPLAEVRDSNLPGPDGISGIEPLVGSGMVSPAEADRVIATFAGGFKREHGAFHSGPLAQINHGSHYGFIEQGTVLSKLQPGLATLAIRIDGRVEMRTWSESGLSRLATIRDARQNGVPLIEYDAASGVSLPGAQVNQWGPGNWSGSAQELLRTVRGGVCLQENAGRRFLLFGYFSSATPSAMARVFQAYACRYAMLLDINALEHTYLAVYAHRGSERVVEHLVQGMEQVDEYTQRGLAPRFVAFPDNRDFFYLLRESKP